MESSSADNWAAYKASDIPSKGLQLPQLFYDTLQKVETEGHAPVTHAYNPNPAFKLVRTLELGCGCGALSDYLSKVRKHVVIGTDVNQEALEMARGSAKLPFTTNFLVADVTRTAMVEEMDQMLKLHVNTIFLPFGTAGSTCRGMFDFVVLQLLLSIIGGVMERTQTLQNALTMCRPGGFLYLSCSGVSDDINPKYAELYQQDRSITGEDYTYLSRDDTGKVLYTTHHFQSDELKELLASVGFEDIHIEKVKETSSRRPEEAANFLYATARRPAV